MVNSGLEGLNAMYAQRVKYTYMYAPKLSHFSLGVVREWLAAFHAGVRGSFPGFGGLEETKMFPPHPRVKLSFVGSLRDREETCLASDRRDLNFESFVWRSVSSHLSHHPQGVLLAQFSLYVHKSGLKPDSFHFAPVQLYQFPGVF